MEFGTLGCHCAYDSCKQHDFLPFQCKHCNLSFCMHHRQRELHECKTLEEERIQQQQQQQLEAPPKLKHLNPYKCSAPHCHTREITANLCRNCHNNYCLKHRFPNQHECTAQVGGHNVILRKEEQQLLSSSASAILAARTGKACAVESATTASTSRNSNIASKSRLLQQQQQISNKSPQQQSSPQQKVH